MSPLDQVTFWAQVLEDSRRTIICSAENESRIKDWLAARGYGLYTVSASRACPNDRLYIIDDNAIKADAQRVLTRGLRPWGRS